MHPQTMVIRLANAHSAPVTGKPNIEEFWSGAHLPTIRSRLSKSIALEGSEGSFCCYFTSMADNIHRNIQYLALEGGMVKKSASRIVLATFIAFRIPLGVGQPTPHVTEYLESWTGQTGKADQTDKKRVEKLSQIECVDVQPRDGSVHGCNLQFEDGGHYELTVGQSVKTSDSTVIGLTCSTQPQSAAKTTYCKLSINPTD